jgi:hypothetical protein
MQEKDEWTMERKVHVMHDDYVGDQSRACLLEPRVEESSLESFEFVRVRAKSVAITLKFK